MSQSPAQRRLPSLAPLLLAVTALAYAPVWQAGFLWDDDDYVTNNLTLTEPGGLQRIWFEPGAVPQYYPLVHTTFWFEKRLFGDSPRGYHLVNVALHILGALLLRRVLQQLAVPGAWAIAFLFAVHPVHVESVAWITERKNVLSGVCYFLAMLALVRERWSSSEEPRSGMPGGWYWIGLVAFVAAMFSKTVACSLPASFLLLVYWKEGRVRWRDVVTMLPLFAIGVALGLLTVSMEKERVGAVGAEWALSMVERCLIAGRALWFYAGKLVWPHPLAFIYPRWNVDGSSVLQMLFPALAVGFLGMLWLQRRFLGRGPLVAALIFGGTLFPALGFFDVYPMRFSFVADHFQYLASVAGITFLVGIGLVALRRFPSWEARRVWIAGSLVGLLSVITFVQARAYRDLETLWRDTVAKNPQGFLAQYNLAHLLFERGDRTEALELFEEAARNHPTDLPIVFTFGRILEEVGDTARAEQIYRSVLQQTPNNADGRLGHFNARLNLGNILGRTGRMAEAKQVLEPGLEVTRKDVADLSLHGMLRLSYGRVLGSLGDSRSEEVLREALEITWTLATSPQDSARNGPKAVQLAMALAQQLPPGPRVFDVLAAAHAEVGNRDAAVEAAERGVRAAKARGDGEQAKAIEARLRLYERRGRYRSSEAFRD